MSVLARTHGLPRDPDLRPGDLGERARAAGSMTALEAEFKRLGLADEEISIRMTGCPNGCVRPYLAEIGLVGRGGGGTTCLSPAALIGTRLNKLYRKDVGHAAVVAAVAPLFEAYAHEARAGRAFLRLCHPRGRGAADAYGW